MKHISKLRKIRSEVKEEANNLLIDSDVMDFGSNVALRYDELVNTIRSLDEVIKHLETVEHLEIGES
jgi:hypothetical protein